MKRPYIRLAYALNRLQILVRDRSTTEARIQFLGGHCGGRNRDVDADGAGRAHCVSGIAHQEQAVARPIVDEANDAFKWEEGREVLEPISEIGEDRVEFAHAAGHRLHSVLAPTFPFAGWEGDPGLDVVRVLGKNQTSYLIAQRDVKGAG